LLQRYYQSKEEHQKGKYFSIEVDEIFDLMLFRDDLYSYYCDFKNGKVGIRTAEKVRAFCIDLDSVSTKDLKDLVKNRFSKIKHSPTYIVNSGNGLHLIYLYREPLDISAGGRLFGARELLKKLITHFEPSKRHGYKLDGQSANLVQPYRVPGSLTKAKMISTVYKSGPEYSLSEMEEWLQWRIFNAEEKPTSNSKKNNVHHFPNGKNGFYQYCLKKIRFPEKKNRYLAMFGLAIIAWKCRIPQERLERDLKDLLNYYNSHARQSSAGLMKENEIDKAMTGYNNKFVKVTSKKLSEYLGIEFKKAKRNGLSQKEHLKKVAENKAASNRKLVFQFIDDNPGCNQSKIARSLSMSTTTVRKYFHEYYKTNGS